MISLNEWRNKKLVKEGLGDIASGIQNLMGQNPMGGGNIDQELKNFEKSMNDVTKSFQNIKSKFPELQKMMSKPGQPPGNNPPQGNPTTPPQATPPTAPPMTGGAQTM